MGGISASTASEEIRVTFSEFCAAPRVKFIEPVSTTLRSMVIALAWASRTPRSIQIGTPARAKGSIPLPRSRGVGLVGDQLDVDASLLGSDERLNGPDPMVRA